VRTYEINIHVAVKDHREFTKLYLDIEDKFTKYIHGMSWKATTKEEN